MHFLWNRVNLKFEKKFGQWHWRENAIGTSVQNIRWGRHQTAVSSSPVHPHSSKACNSHDELTSDSRWRAVIIFKLIDCLKSSSVLVLKFNLIDCVWKVVWCWFWNFNCFVRLDAFVHFGRKNWVGWDHSENTTVSTSVSVSVSLYQKSFSA